MGGLIFNFSLLALIAGSAHAATAAAAHAADRNFAGAAMAEVKRSEKAILLAASNDSGGRPMNNTAQQAASPDSFFRGLTRSGKPNNWLIAPEGFAIGADARSPVFDVPVRTLTEAISGVALANGRAKVIERADHSVHILDTTAVMGFKDDVYIQFVPLGAKQSTLAVYSESQIGYWDFGKNRRRIEEWIRETQNRLSAGR